MIMSHPLTPDCFGTFVPARASELRAAIHGFLAEVTPQPCHPNAIIVPHAGYGYSGPIAASAYIHLTSVAAHTGRVVLLGTCHIPGVQGLVTTTADAVVTPLGKISFDRSEIERVVGLPQVKVDDQAHQRDHALAVQLPWLQELLLDFTVMPLLVGRSSYQDVAEVLELLWNGEKTLVVVSSDLSHYHDYATARRLDAATAETIVAFQPEQLSPEQACGHRAIGGLLLVARRRGLKAKVVDLRNSGDTRGQRDRVVGYGAFVFYDGWQKET